MLKGTVRISLRLSESDEWALYRETEGGQRFLLFSFGENWKQAYEKGKAIAHVLGVSFRAAQAPPSIPKTKQEKADFGKTKRVTGATKLCRQMLANESPTSAIIDALMEKYISAGRDEKYARSSAEYILKYEKSIQK